DEPGQEQGLPEAHRERLPSSASSILGTGTRSSTSSSTRSASTPAGGASEGGGGARARRACAGLMEPRGEAPNSTQPCSSISRVAVVSATAYSITRRST